MRVFIWIAVVLLVITVFATQGAVFGMSWAFWLALGLLSWCLNDATGFVVPLQGRPPQQ